MASWIKMRTDLADDPAVIAMAGRLHCNEFMVVGLLHAVWAWADSHTTDGHAASVTAAWLNSRFRCDGLAEAMQAVGWLELDAAGLTIPNFDRHNGESAKKRALAAERKRRERSESHADVPDLSRGERDVSRDQIREDKKKDTSTPNGVEGASPAAKPIKVPPVDHEAIVAAFHELLPDHPRVEVWSDKRRGLLRKRWAELAVADAKKNRPWENTAAGVERFRAFFTYVGQSKFLTGRTKPNGDRKPFVADLPWLLLPENFLKTVEGKYHSET